MNCPRTVRTLPLLPLLALAAAGCTTSPEKGDDMGRPPSSRLAFLVQWTDAILDLGRYPVMPPSEDVYVGDIFALSASPGAGTATTAEGLRAMSTPRWKSLEVLSLLDAEYRKRPSWNHSSAILGLANDEQASEDAGGESIYRTDRAPKRQRLVGLRSMSNLTVDSQDLEPFIPIEIAPLINGLATSDRFAVSLQAGEAETYSLSLDTILDVLVEPSEPDSGAPYVLRDEHRHGLQLMADPNTGLVYLIVATEVLYVRSVEVTIRKRFETPQRIAEDGTTIVDPSPPWLPDGTDVATAAILRAEAMNDALRASGIEDRVGGTVKIVMATDDAFTLRRRWPYPLAMAIRGVTLEVEAATGQVRRMGPLGTALPQLAAPPQADAPAEGAVEVPATNAAVPPVTDSASSGS